MATICSHLKRFCFLSLLAVSPLSFLLGKVTDKEKAKQFETLATHSSGLFSDFPEVVRSLRLGAVTQTAHITDDGYLVISRSFACKKFPGISDGTSKATSIKKVSLNHLKGSSTCRFEVNRHVNTIQIIDKNWSLPLAFRSAEDLEKACSLLTSLVATAEKPQGAPSFSPSLLAEQAGYKYLVAAPRYEDVTEGVRLLSMEEHSPRLLCYLTKLSPEETEAVLEESLNRLPLFFFDLKTLDEIPFFTESISEATEYTPCSLSSSLMQSVCSYDKEGLTQFLKLSANVGIRFESMPEELSLKAVICKPYQEHKIRKTLKALKLHMKDTQWHLHRGLGWFEGVPRGTASSWFSSAEENADDVLRYCLLSRTMTPTLLRYTIYYEFPSLHNLLQTKSRYQKELSLEEMIYLSSQALVKRSAKFPEFLGRVLRIALFTHELGRAFGADKDIGYNSWPLALCVAEKAGCTEQEKTALEWLVDSQSIPGAPLVDKKKKIDPVVLAFARESQAADQIGISLKDWLAIKECFYECLAACGKPSGECQEPLQVIKAIRKKFKPLLPFGIGRGVLYCQGDLPTRRLYSSYVWEARDSQHRDGLSLKRRREKFERLVVEGGKIALKGRFWDWLEKEVREEPLYPSKYLHEGERNQYLAVCEQGVLSTSLLFPSNDEKEVLFVLDDFGRMYLGIKKEGEGIKAPGFSHASFLGGRSVAAAGKLLLRNGKPYGITDHSGHYRCGSQELALALYALEKMGVSIEEIEVYAGTGGEKEHFVSAKEYLRTRSPIFRK